MKGRICSQPMRSVILLVLSGVLAWPQAPASWTPELAMQVQTVASVVPSPDGKRVAWTQSQAAMTGEQSEWISQIYLAGADGAGRIQLTRHEKGAQSPLFSPDGRFLYFSSPRSGKNNLWRIPADGGEAEMLTDWKGTLGRFAVSPCGKWVAFTGVEESADDEKAKKEKRDFRVVGEKAPEPRAVDHPGRSRRRRQTDAEKGGRGALPHRGIRLVARFPFPGLRALARAGGRPVDQGRYLRGGDCQWQREARGRNRGGRIESRLLARRPLDRVSHQRRAATLARRNAHRAGRARERRAAPASRDRRPGAGACGLGRRFLGHPVQRSAPHPARHLCHGAGRQDPRRLRAGERNISRGLVEQPGHRTLGW